MAEILTEQQEHAPEETPEQDAPLEEPEEEQEDEQAPPQEEEPEASEPPSEADMEKAVKALEKEATRHRNRVSEIMGADAQSLVPCELCEPAIPGFHWPTPPDYDTSQRVLAALGQGDLAKHQADPDAETCDLCDGLGETLTGSKVLTQRTRPCPECQGNGWTTPEQRNAWTSTRGAQAAAAASTPTGEEGLRPSTSLPPVDAWGRQVGHPNYGKNPVYMTDAERAADPPGVA